MGRGASAAVALIIGTVAISDLRVSLIEVEMQVVSAIGTDQQAGKHILLALVGSALADFAPFLLMRREDLNRDLTQKRSALFGIIRYLASSPSLLECPYWFWRVSVSVRSLSPFLWHGFWAGCNLYFIFRRTKDD